MTSGFDAFEEYVLAEMRDTYSETVIDHVMHPRNVGSLPQPDGQANVTGPCGDTMEIWIRVENNTIAEATFWTDGCGTTIAAGSMITELAKARKLAPAMRISQEDVVEALGGLPEESVHCALLAANTLKEAIKDYLEMTKAPWKKIYR